MNIGRYKVSPWKDCYGFIGQISRYEKSISFKEKEGCVVWVQKYRQNQTKYKQNQVIISIFFLDAPDLKSYLSSLDNQIFPSIEEAKLKVDNLLEKISKLSVLL